MNIYSSHPLEEMMYLLNVSLLAPFCVFQDHSLRDTVAHVPIIEAENVNTSFELILMP